MRRSISAARRWPCVSTACCVWAPSAGGLAPTRARSPAPAVGNSCNQHAQHLLATHRPGWMRSGRHRRRTRRQRCGRCKPISAGVAGAGGGLAPSRACLCSCTHTQLLHSIPACPPGGSLRGAPCCGADPELRCSRKALAQQGGSPAQRHSGLLAVSAGVKRASGVGRGAAKGRGGRAGGSAGGGGANSAEGKRDLSLLAQPVDNDCQASLDSCQASVGRLFVRREILGTRSSTCWAMQPLQIHATMHDACVASAIIVSMLYRAHTPVGTHALAGSPVPRLAPYAPRRIMADGRCVQHGRPDNPASPRVHA